MCGHAPTHGKNDLENANYLAKELRILYTISSGATHPASRSRPKGQSPKGGQTGGGAERARKRERPKPERRAADTIKQRRALKNETQVYYESLRERSLLVLQHWKRVR